jgi:DNA-binding transcriptional ArsR family regulator
VPSDEEMAVLRALGSSARQDILELLGRGPATSAMLARALSSNTGVMSYHLRELGKAGLIEEDRQAGRSLYWRLSRSDVRFADRQRSEHPAMAEAAGDLLFARFTASVGQFRARTDLEPAWHDAAMFSQSATTLTATELASFVDEYMQLLQRWAGRGASSADARPVRIALFAYPDGDPLPEDNNHD